MIHSGVKLNLLDVRTPGEFARVHATGARLIPLDELNATSAATLRVSDEEPLYVLCHSGTRAGKACEQLEAMGIGPVFRVDGGTEAWERAGLPVTKSSAGAISLERQVRIVAGSLVLVGLILARLVHPAFAGLSAFIGAGLVFAGVTDFCGMGLLLARMPWNRGAATCAQRSAGKRLPNIASAKMNHPPSADM